MKGVNQWIGIGTLGRDPETRMLPNGDAVTSFSIACNDSYTKDGKKVESVEWVNLVAFKRLAEIAGEYLRKGSRVYVSGQLKTRNWEKDGQKHFKTEVVLRELQMLDARSEERKPAAVASSYEDDDDIPF